MIMIGIVVYYYLTAVYVMDKAGPQFAIEDKAP